MAKPVVVLGSDYLPYVSAALAAALPEAEVVALDLSEGVASAGAEGMSALARADVLMPIRGRIDRGVLEASPRCRLIQQFGAGLDSVDHDAASALGIPVARVPSDRGGNARSVAEHALMLMLMCGRDIHRLDVALKTGDWAQPPAKSVFGKTVAILGYGGIGRALRELLRPFDCRVILVVRDPQSAVIGEDDVELAATADLVDVTGRSDYLVVCVPLTDQTRGLIDAEVLAAAGAKTTIVNVSRGAIVDEDDWRAWSKSDEVAVSGFDVFWQEPIAPGDSILAQGNLIATPHCAGLTDAMIQATAKECAQSIRAALDDHAAAGD